MGTAFQKVGISTALLIACGLSPWVQAQSLNACGQGPLMVGQKQVGVASYFAQNGFVAQRLEMQSAPN